uniref:Putative oxidoreductase C66306c (Trinotate prediction) n=1 Tax=Myxobolus squamalis TaxID=59785 RepID=A0A6B2FYT2_MYXSQ
MSCCNDNTGAKNFLITGANRGLGLGLVREILKNCCQSKVFATVRDLHDCKDLKDLAIQYKNLHILKLDITSQLDIDQLVKELESVLKDEGLQYLINNAGVLTRVDPNKGVQFGIPPNIFGESEESFMETYRVNVVGPFLLSRKLIPLLTKGASKNHNLDHSVIFNMGSFLGSNTLNKDGGYFSYRASKAAFHMLTKSFSIELQEHKIMAIVISPGWVKTRMGGEGAQIEVDQSVQGMLKVLRNITLKDNGTHIDYTGKVIPF